MLAGDRQCRRAAAGALPTPPIDIANAHIGNDLQLLLGRLHCSEKSVQKLAIYYKARYRDS